MATRNTPCPGVRLRASYADRCISMPGVFNALVAKMAERALEAIRRSGSQQAILGSMYSRVELYDLLGYEGYEEHDKAYLGETSGGDGDDS